MSDNNFVFNTFAELRAREKLLKKFKDEHVGLPQLLQKITIDPTVSNMIASFDELFHIVGRFVGQNHYGTHGILKTVDDRRLELRYTYKAILYIIDSLLEDCGYCRIIENDRRIMPVYDSLSIAFGYSHNRIHNELTQQHKDNVIPDEFRIDQRSRLFPKERLAVIEFYIGLSNPRDKVKMFFVADLALCGYFRDFVKSNYGVQRSYVFDAKHFEEMTTGRREYKIIMSSNLIKEICDGQVEFIDECFLTDTLRYPILLKKDESYGFVLCPNCEHFVDCLGNDYSNDDSNDDSTSEELEPGCSGYSDPKDPKELQCQSPDEKSFPEFLNSLFVVLEKDCSMSMRMEYFSALSDFIIVATRNVCNNAYGIYNDIVNTFLKDVARTIGETKFDETLAEILGLRIKICEMSLVMYHASQKIPKIPFTGKNEHDDVC